MTGFVSFVSAGPGDPELLTLKASVRLEAADVRKRAARLVVAGLSAQTPPLLAKNVGHADQRLIRNSIGGLAGVLAEGVGLAPALILYGPWLEEA